MQELPSTVVEWKERTTEWLIGHSLGAERDKTEVAQDDRQVMRGTKIRKYTHDLTML